MFVSNRLSHIDHIVLHLVLNCVTVSRQTHSQAPSLRPGNEAKKDFANLEHLRTAVNKHMFDGMSGK